MRSKQLTSGTGLVLAACLFISINIIVNTLVTNWRLDLTEDSLYTLSEGTLNILDDIDEPITLRMYFSREQLLGYPQLVNYGVRVRDMLREYVANSDGMLHLEVIDPKPFTDAEDAAVAEGLRSMQVGNAGEQAYFGLVGSNSIDDTEVIPFFAPNRESALEYELSKMVYKLANPERQVVGVIGDLPLFKGGGERGAVATSIIRVMREFFEVRELETDASFISNDIEVLMVVHPKTLDDTTLYAIDQFVLKGGKLMVLVDPFAEADQTPPSKDNPLAMPDRDSDFTRLFEPWGINIPQEKIVGDMQAAIRVQHRGQRGAQEIPYLPWLQLTQDNLNQDDFITSELNQVQLGTSSYIEKLPDSELTIEPLLQTSTRSTILERDLIILQRDPTIIIDNFEPSGERYTLAARISGPVKTAFPDGKPLQEGRHGREEDPDYVSEGNINAVVVADTDIINDRFWVREQDYYGMKVPQPIADNGDFITNALDNLAGNTDLISLRSRGTFDRPFEVVERIRRAAEADYREREQQLQNKLQQAQADIEELQQESGMSGLIMSKEQAEKIEKTRREQMEVRKELREVQHNLKKDIEQLASRLRFINIGLIPLLIALVAVGIGLYRVYSRKRT
ncbi:MAG: Gldg family protein [Gammaproteobacteria bacterium]|nr:Gldg family protein [Gammaproteobacteria bacterium]